MNSINNSSTGNGFPGSKKKAEMNGRDTLSVEQWATGKIEATPHGVFSKSFTPSSSSGNNVDSVNSNTNKKTNKSNESSIFLDHFNVPKGREAVDAEMPRGKRIQPIIAP